MEVGPYQKWRDFIYLLALETQQAFCCFFIRAGFVTGCNRSPVTVKVTRDYKSWQVAMSWLSTCVRMQMCCVILMTLTALYLKKKKKQFASWSEVFCWVTCRNMHHDFLIYGCGWFTWCTQPVQMLALGIASMEGGMLLLLITPPPPIVPVALKLLRLVPCQIILWFCTPHYCCTRNGYFSLLLTLCATLFSYPLFFVVDSLGGGAPVQTNGMGANAHQRLFLLAQVHHREERIYLMPGVSFLCFWRLHHDGPRLFLFCRPEKLYQQVPFNQVLTSSSSRIRQCLNFSYILKIPMSRAVEALHVHRIYTK